MGRLARKWCRALSARLECGATAQDWLPSLGPGGGAAAKRPRPDVQSRDQRGACLPRDRTRPVDPERGTDRQAWEQTTAAAHGGALPVSAACRAKTIGPWQPSSSPGRSTFRPELGATGAERLGLVRTNRRRGLHARRRLRTRQLARAWGEPARQAGQCASRLRSSFCSAGRMPCCSNAGAAPRAIRPVRSPHLARLCHFAAVFGS